MAVCDAIAPDDFLLHSALGASDGRAYEHLIKEFESRANIRPNWWGDLSSFLRARTDPDSEAA